MDLPRHQNIVHGFTLLELLIVVVILSVLASIVVPSFTISSSETAESIILANTTVVQSAIDRYRIEHGDYPQATTSTSGCATYTDGQPSVELREMKNFIDRMRLYTNKAGEACNSRSAGKYMLGPYIRKPVPKNPLCGFDKVYVHSSTDKQPTKNEQFGWGYNYNNGEFFALRAEHGCSKESGQGSLSYSFLLLLGWLKSISLCYRRKFLKHSVDVRMV